jgi:hypothetical protein
MKNAGFSSASSKRKYWQFSKQPSPTILGPNSQKRSGLSKPMQAVIDATDENEDCVTRKLEAALCLKHARNVGLRSDIVTLRDFALKGGAQYVAREVVRHLSVSSATHAVRVQRFDEILPSFCETFAISKDQAMLDCSTDLCRGKLVSASTIEVCCSIARSCSAVSVKCQVALLVFRAALLCSTTHVALSLSEDSINWASSDSNLQSELKEASRILCIDQTVLKYCGSGARELFRVDNPRHAMRLLDFVTGHVERESVLADAISLCDGYHHLCPKSAACKLLENAMLHQDEGLCTKLLERLTGHDMLLAETAFVHSISFSEEILADCSRRTYAGCSADQLDVCQLRARTIASRMCALNRCAAESKIVTSAQLFAEVDFCLKGNTAEVVRDAFLSIERLQRDHSVYVSLAELARLKTVVHKVSFFIEAFAESFILGDAAHAPAKLAEARRVCALLTVLCKQDARDVWSAASMKVVKSVIAERNEDLLEPFLSCVSMLTPTRDELPIRAQIAVAFALCNESMRPNITPLQGMNKLVNATSLLRDRSIVTATGKMLTEIISFAGHLDLACQILSRCEEVTGETVESLLRRLQSRAWHGVSKPYADGSQLQTNRTLQKPVFQPSWYVGDGLLLPPKESFAKCLLFCKDMIHVSSASCDGVTGLVSLTGGRGACSLALRILIHAMSVRVCARAAAKEDWLDALEDAFGETSRSLAERSLGGTRSGITSSIVDSQQAVSFLLILPIQEAFAAYSSIIPVATKTKNSARLFAISNVGLMAAGPEESKTRSVPMSSVGWKRQQKFFEQCRQLSEEAKWWTILQENAIHFDLQHFQDLKKAANSSADGSLHMGKSATSYAATILPALTEKLFQRLDGSNTIRLTSQYSNTFRVPLEIVLRGHVEFLLTASNGMYGSSEKFDRSACEREVISSLRLVQPGSERISVLKRCLANLDMLENSGQDYERYGLALQLYRDALISAHTQGFADGTCNFEAELRVVDRRVDALTILSAFFQGDRIPARPSFSRLFDDKGTTRPCSILGPSASSRNENVFDPLLPLDPILSECYDSTVVTALAPLCNPLGLPQGYIHARSLMARFRRSQGCNVDYPSFEHDVAPVLNRIVGNSDRALLADWCAQQYASNEDEKLKCYDVFYQSFILASGEIEQRRRQNPTDSVLRACELEALDKLKGIGLRKDALADVLRVKKVLISSSASENRAVKQAYARFVSDLEGYAQTNPDLSPEDLIDFLYREGSLLATQAILDKSFTFSMCHFRQICSTVHEACEAIADQHSHIVASYRASQFAQQWLFHGDEIKGSFSDRSVAEPSVRQHLDSSHDDETNDFVMDLSTIQGMGSSPGTVGSSKNQRTSKDVKVSSTEEVSILRALSAREMSDEVSQRAALRIAFVLAFSCPDSGVSEDASKENTNPSSSLNPSHGAGKLKRQLPTRQTDGALVHSSELLGIAFAKSGAISNFIKRSRLFEAESTGGQRSEMQAPKTITFAMRHRALQTAAILCPQESLEEVIQQEGYLRSGNNEKQCTLRQCTLGAFVAKEIEDMGLPLPHSDLEHLSTMSFSSYAKALWRHHRDNSILRNKKGRLLLLLIELSLHSETDAAFMSSVVDEILHLNLPRTLLVAMERIADSQTKNNEASLLNEMTAEKAISTLASSALTEMRKLLSEADIDDSLMHSDVSATFESLIKIVFVFMDPSLASKEFGLFVTALSAACQTQQKPLAEKLQQSITESYKRCSMRARVIKVNVPSEICMLPSTIDTASQCTPVVKPRG